MCLWVLKAIETEWLLSCQLESSSSSLTLACPDTVEDTCPTLKELDLSVEVDSH